MNVLLYKFERDPKGEIIANTFSILSPKLVVLTYLIAKTKEIRMVSFIKQGAAVQRVFQVSLCLGFTNHVSETVRNTFLEKAAFFQMEHIMVPEIRYIEKVLFPSSWNGQTGFSGYNNIKFLITLALKRRLSVIIGFSLKICRMLATISTN